MASFKAFEDLPVWKLSAVFASEILPWTASHPGFRGTGDMANQIQRAALSISNNIAEGFDRGSNKELIQYLYISRGSTSEVRSMLKVMRLMKAFDGDQQVISRFVAMTVDISRQLGGWIKSLKNSTIRGEKFLNEQSKQDYQRMKRREIVLAELEQGKKDLEAKILADLDRRHREQ